jgi:hypothetical protein
VQLSASGGEQVDQHRGLRRDMQARRHGQPGERLLPLERIPDQAQHGHGPLSPADPGLADCDLARIGGLYPIAAGHAQ